MKHSNPDLGTVPPLSIGTRNHCCPIVSPSGGGGLGGKNNRPIIIEVPVIIDNRMFGRAVKKVALEDFGLQV